MYVQNNIQGHSRNHCCSGKPGSTVLRIECVSVALVSYHAMRMRRIMSSVAQPALQYFSTSPHKRHDFQKKKKILNVKGVL